MKVWIWYEHMNMRYVVQNNVWVNVDKVICDQILECAIMCDDQVRYWGKVLQYVSIVDRIFGQRESRFPRPWRSCVAFHHSYCELRGSDFQYWGWGRLLLEHMISKWFMTYWMMPLGWCGEALEHLCFNESTFIRIWNRGGWKGPSPLRILTGFLDPFRYISLPSFIASVFNFLPVYIKINHNLVSFQSYIFFWVNELLEKSSCWLCKAIDIFNLIFNIL